MTSFRTVAPPPGPAQVQMPPGAVGAPFVGRWSQSIHSDAKVPLAQAAIGGWLIAAGVGVVGGELIYLSKADLLTLAPGLLAAVVTIGILGTAVLWFVQLRAVQATWWNAELLAGQDLDGDGVVGQPGRLTVGAVAVHAWSDQEKMDAEALRRLRFEEFVAKLYRVEKTDTETIRGLGFSEDERKTFIEALRGANVIRQTRKGNAAGWVFMPQDAGECIALCRRRVMFMSRESSSSSSSGEI